MERQPRRETAATRQPDGLRFFAFADRDGVLTVRPYRSYEEHSATRARPDVIETTPMFTASGHVEARQKARELIGHLEKPADLNRLFKGKGDAGGGDGTKD